MGQNSNQSTIEMNYGIQDEIFYFLFFTTCWWEEVLWHHEVWCESQSWECKRECPLERGYVCHLYSKIVKHNYDVREHCRVGFVHIGEVSESYWNGWNTHLMVI